MTIYLRTQGLPHHRVMDYPLDDNHPLVTHNVICPGCGLMFFHGDLVTLVVLGPGSDPEEQMKCRANKPYNAVAVAVHTACATGELPNP